MYLGNMDSASWWMEDVKEDAAVREVRSAQPSLWPLVLLTPGPEQLALGEKSLVDQLGLVLEPDPVWGFMLPHCMLKDHDFEHPLGFRVRGICTD